MESPFDVLGVDADADEAEIERAYRERVKEAHPDHGGSLEEFGAVRAAYEEAMAGGPDPRATARNGAEDQGDEADDAEEGAETVATVTYLNYDVLSEFGWDVDDEDLFEKAAEADLDEEDYGRFGVGPRESVLEAAEEHGYAWPFACRGGACANCAILLRTGEISMAVDHVLPPELMEQGYRLSCNGMPVTEELEVVYNVKHVPELDDLLLPPRPFEQMYSDD